MKKKKNVINRKSDRDYPKMINETKTLFDTKEHDYSKKSKTLARHTYHQGSFGFVTSNQL